jgi:hypothetical protein
MINRRQILRAAPFMALTPAALSAPSMAQAISAEDRQTPLISVATETHNATDNWRTGVRNMKVLPSYSMEGKNVTIGNAVKEWSYTNTVSTSH